jgi:hypothetical protein
MLEDVGWFDVSVDYSHFEEVLGSLYDFGNDEDGLLLT